MKDLVQIIKDNPGCVAVIDNDYWVLHKEHPDKNPHDEIDDGWEKFDKWEKQNELATADSIAPLGDGGYGSGNCYGGDILQALSQIVGMTVESV